jgi:hypothetical protein
MKKTNPVVPWLAMAILFCPFARAADVPPYLHYQARLLNSDGTVHNEAVALKFALFHQETAGQNVWEEAFPSVNVNGGLLRVELGHTQPLSASVFSDGAVWMEITVNNETLAPRVRLTPTPYAFHSQTSESAASAASAQKIIVDNEALTLHKSGSLWVFPVHPESFHECFSTCYGQLVLSETTPTCTYYTDGANQCNSCPSIAHVVCKTESGATCGIGTEYSCAIPHTLDGTKLGDLLIP